MSEAISKKTIQTLIGERFEDIFERQFCDFEKQSDKDGEPDFFNGKIWVETKTGFIHYGVRLKPRQIKFFQRIKSAPVLYAVGYHNFENSIERLNGLDEDEVRETLRKEMRIVRSYFVSEDIIRSIWKEESRTAPNSLITYAMLKERFLKAIIENKHFFRGGNHYTPGTYYHVYRSNYHLKMAPLFTELTEKLNYGLLLQKNDRRIERFLEERNLV